MVMVLLIVKFEDFLDRSPRSDTGGLAVPRRRYAPTDAGISLSAESFGNSMRCRGASVIAAELAFWSTPAMQGGVRRRSSMRRASVSSSSSCCTRDSRRHCLCRRSNGYHRTRLSARVARSICELERRWGIAACWEARTRGRFRGPSQGEGKRLCRLSRRLQASKPLRRL